MDTLQSWQGGVKMLGKCGTACDREVHHHTQFGRSGASVKPPSHGAIVKTTSERNGTALHDALRNRGKSYEERTSQIKSLILNGAGLELNAREKNDASYEMIPYVCDEPLIRSFVERHLDFSRYSESKLFGLVRAAMENKPDSELLKFLVERKQLNVCKVESLNGYSAVHAAVSASNIACLKYLIERGADINGRTAYGTTPLREAIVNENMECLELCLFNEADVDAPCTRDGSFPLSLAMSCEDEDCRKLMARCIIARIVLVAEILGNPIAAKNWSVIELNESLSTVYEDCKTELESKICDSVTVLDFLSRPNSYARNQCVIEAMRNFDNSTIYRNFLVYSFMKARERVALEDDAELAAELLFKRKFQTLVPVFQKIFKYLENEDLKTLVSLCYQSELFK